MKNKKRVQYNWQVLLLCLFVSVPHPALAKSPSTPSTEKHAPKKPTNTKAKPTARSQRGTEVDTSRRPPQRSQRELTSEKTQGKQTTASSLREKRQLRSQTTDQGTAKRAVQPKLSLPQQHQTNTRYVTVLKETKRHTLVKTTIALPVINERTPKRKGAPEAKLALPQPHRNVGEFPRKSVSPVVQSAIPAAPPENSRDPSPSLVLETTSAPQPVPAQPTSAGPVQPPLAPVLVPPQPQETIVNVVSSSVRNANESRSPAVSAPTPARNAGTITFVEHRPTQRLGKDDSSAKEKAAYSAQRAPFAVAVNDDRLNYRINSVFVLPGDEIFVEIFDSQKKAEYTIHSALGSERLLAQRRWRWFAPTTAGLYPVKIVHARSRNSITLNVFVMIPREQVHDGYLNGYRIGQYPTEALRQLPMYVPPRGLIEITPENENTLVSPHFRLRQFLCKQESGYPKYMILDPRLLATLEQLLEMVNARGYRARTFSIMSGYRTPYYNRAIGNRTTYSRHLWGDAADIFIDEEPRDGKMDDLNQDGVVDAHDADVIYQIIESTTEPRLQKVMLGGLARYRETSSHGPFIHVDARGSYARWGVKTLTRGGTTSTDTVFPGHDQSRSRPSFLDAQNLSDPTP